MNTHARWPFLVLLVLALAACSGASAPQNGPATRYDRTRLTQQEIAATTAANAFEAVRILRPQWLRRRGAVSITQQSDIVVYVDDVRFGGPQSLQGLSAASVISIQYLDASSATQRWGTDHVHGAILVRTM